MKSSFLSIVSIILLLSFCSAKIPNYEDAYVNDFANVLDLTDASIIREAFEVVFWNTTSQIVFVSLVSIDGEISDYATQIGQAWGVGDPEKDNGVVILYVGDINKIWVATGYGVEGVFPDSKIGRYLDEYYVPYRDSGEVSFGIREFSLAFSQEMIDNYEELLSENVNNSKSVFWIILFIILFILVLYFLVNHGRRNSSRGFIPIILSGGTVGGGSFGGGSFGGGGAGR